MKKTLGIIIVTLIILAVISYLRNEVKTRLLNHNSVTPSSATQNSKNNTNVDPNGYKNATYILDDQEITLKNGVAEYGTEHDPSVVVLTRYFGNEVIADFNGDRRNDIAFLLSQETGGTGVFFYLVVALNTPDGYVGSNGYFIGDRIAPQSTMLGDRGSIIVNYADRFPGEPYTIEPTFGKSIKLVFDPEYMMFKEVPKN